MRFSNGVAFLTAVAVSSSVLALPLAGSTSDLAVREVDDSLTLDARMIDVSTKVDARHHQTDDVDLGEVPLSQPSHKAKHKPKSKGRRGPKVYEPRPQRRSPIHNPGRSRAGPKGTIKIGRLEIRDLNVPRPRPGFRQSVTLSQLRARAIEELVTDARRARRGSFRPNAGSEIGYNRIRARNRQRVEGFTSPPFRPSHVRKSARRGLVARPSKPDSDIAAPPVEARDEHDQTPKSSSVAPTPTSTAQPTQTSSVAPTTTSGVKPKRRPSKKNLKFKVYKKNGKKCAIAKSGKETCSKWMPILRLKLKFMGGAKEN